MHEGSVGLPILARGDDSNDRPASGQAGSLSGLGDESVARLGDESRPLPEKKLSTPAGRTEREALTLGTAGSGGGDCTGVRTHDWADWRLPEEQARNKLSGSESHRRK